MVTVLDVSGAVGGPTGGVPTTDAVLTIAPASRSAWVTMCAPEHVVVCAGMRVVVAHVIAPASGSETVTDVIVRLPLFETANVNGMLAPAVEYDVVELVLVMLSAAAATAGTVTWFELVGPTAPDPGSVAETVAVLTTEPLFRSASVTVCEPVQVVDCPGASVVARHDTPDVLGSVTLIDDSVTLPVLRTVKEYGIVSPMVEYPVFAVFFEIVIAGVCVALTVTVFDIAGAIGVPPGGVPVTEAVLTTDPESRLAWVTVWVAEQVVEAVGASVVAAHTIPDAFASVIVTDCNVV